MAVKVMFILLCITRRRLFAVLLSVLVLPMARSIETLSDLIRLMLQYPRIHTGSINPKAAHVYVNPEIKINNTLDVSQFDGILCGPILSYSNL